MRLHGRFFYAAKGDANNGWISTGGVHFANVCFLFTLIQISALIESLKLIS